MWKQSNHEIARIEKSGNKFQGKTTAKSMRSWLSGQLIRYSKDKSSEGLQAQLILQGVTNAYNHFHPEITISTEIDSWKGKSSFQILQETDKLIIIKFQKPDKFSEPKEVRTEISKDEIIALLESLNNLNEGEPIKSRIIAMDWSNRLGLGHSGFKVGEKPLFSDRGTHNKFTLLLGAFAELKLIKYLGGKITLASNNKLELQEVLPQ